MKSQPLWSYCGARGIRIMRYPTFLFLLMFIFASLCLVSVPQIVSADEGYSSHTHPHPPRQHCMTCGKYDVPGQHYCPEAEREKQEQDVEISNANANIKRLEEKDDDGDGVMDAIKDTINDNLSNGEKVVLRVIKVVTGIVGNVRCQGCNDWVPSDDELKHWGTGTCAIGHEHWTCRPGEKELRAGCYWVDEPETNPDAMYQKATYSITCSQCGNTSYTNSQSEYEAWQAGFCCDGYSSGLCSQ